jgi:hypothetical protein
MALYNFRIDYRQTDTLYFHSSKIVMKFMADLASLNRER